MTGFQKSQKMALMRRKQREEEKAKITPLNPPFPYAVESLNPAPFHIPANPKKLS